MRTLADRCERALDLVRAMETDGISIGVVFAETALLAARDSETVDETVTMARYADQCLDEADVRGDALRLVREARQVLSLLVCPSCQCSCVRVETDAGPEVVEVSR